MKKSTLSLIVLLVLSLIFSSCEFLEEDQKISVELPEFPPAWQEEFGVPPFTLSYRDAEGKITKMRVESGRKQVEIRAKKGFTVPVTARPQISGLLLVPAGGIAPIDLVGDRLILSWKQGFVSKLLLDLAEEGVELDSLNTERLSSEIADRCGDPFKIDRSYLIKKLVSGKFRVTYIKQLPEKEIEFVPGAGKWLTDNPFSVIQETNPDQELQLELTLGLHRLFDSQSDTRYDIQVGEKEITIMRRL